MKTVKLISSSLLLLVALLYSCNSNGSTNETKKNSEATANTGKTEDKFAGTYKLKNEEGVLMDQTSKIIYENGKYSFQAEGADAIEGTLSEGGKILTFKSEESSKTNADGFIEANLGGEVKIYFEGEKLVCEMIIPDLGIEKMELIRQ